MEYLYNEKSGTLHIKGLCHNTKSDKTGYKSFKTYNEVLAYDGNSVRMCKRFKITKEKIKAKG